MEPPALPPGLAGLGNPLLQEPAVSSGAAPMEPPALPAPEQQAAAADEPPPPPPAPVGLPRRRIVRKAVDPKALDP
eukprot:4436879-Pyramimonas_sp.AAC.1